MAGKQAKFMAGKSPIASTSKSQITSHEVTEKLAGKSEITSTGESEITSQKTQDFMAGKKQLTSTGKPALRLVTNSQFASTGKPPEVIPQQELIGAPADQWRYVKGKPPYPPKHALQAHGKRDIGRNKIVGWQILRVAKCVVCGKRTRPVAGYISPKAMIGLEREKNYEEKIGIVRNILRQSANRDYLNLRCSGCCAGGARIGIPNLKRAVASA